VQSDCHAEVPGSNPGWRNVLLPFFSFVIIEVITDIFATVINVLQTNNNKSIVFKFLSWRKNNF
jgi:hypothetical protein